MPKKREAPEHDYERTRSWLEGAQDPDQTPCECAEQERCPAGPGVGPNVLTLAEATAIVSACFAEDYDTDSLEAAIKRLGDWVDRSVGATCSESGEGEGLIVTEYPERNERHYKCSGCGIEFMVPLDDAPLPAERECDGCAQLLPTRLITPQLTDSGPVPVETPVDEGVEPPA